MVVWKAPLAALAVLTDIAGASTAKRDNSTPNLDRTNVPGAYIAELADSQVPSSAAPRAQPDLTPA